MNYKLADYKPLPRRFFERYTVDVAHDLLGTLLIRTFDDGTVAAGMIVETEAYTGLEDPASHAFRGHTERTRAMFGLVGHAYIYFIYGMYYCLNAVAKSSDQKAGGVLIRALEPVFGLEHMQKRRHHKTAHDLTNGPGKLTQALGINKKLYGIDLTQHTALYCAQYKKIPARSIIAGPRIGISKAADRPWRFYIADNPYVSR